ncbi:MAG: pheA [Candidatus Saccharibacteria bacterium]|jgi:prephenate dehydratase|nr:pheA [Candidatus Saccharibacteria bacterium]
MTAIAISAIAGSFTEEAARRYLKDAKQAADFVYVGTAQGAFKIVAEGRSELGIVPIRNSNAGFVIENLRASADYTYKIVHIFSMPIRQNLLVLPGVTKSEIKQITSQLPALAQSQEYLRREWRGTPVKEYIDTALAARDLAEGKLPRSTAVVASASAAELYHLHILKANIQTDKTNTTDFMVFTRHSKAQ